MGGHIAMLAIVQADPAILAQLERIAIAQLVIATAAGFVLLLTLALAFVALRAVRAANRAVARVTSEIGPRLDPLLEKAGRIADDANDVSDSLRRKVNELTGTLEELNVSVRRASRSAQQRAREFAAVIDVVQAEAEALLLDAAATARGVHTTAEVLRAPAARRARPRRGDMPSPSPPPAREGSDNDGQPEVV